MRKKLKKALTMMMVALLTLIPLSEVGVIARADDALEDTVKSNLVIPEAERKQLLTGDVSLPTSIAGLPNADITYSIKEVAPATTDLGGVTVEANDTSATLKVTRPYAGRGDIPFTLVANVQSDGESCAVEFPMTVRAGLSDDSYAGYIYTCFATRNGPDVQQVHFFLSEDGLNWTALNGCKPAFLAGEDHQDAISSYGGSSVNYRINSGTDIAETTKGDASVLFPFEGNDQGIRDPYIIRGAKADGSDANKVWILATDLNTHAPKYGGNMTGNQVGNWGNMANSGSTKLFIYETEDWVNWERRYIEVGLPVQGGAAWAPEAIYNPEKDNYLIYWSSRSTIDGSSRNRVYCAETTDFAEVGPSKLYESEPYYEKYKPNGRGSNDGYGNIDTSQLWVADEEGNPYGTLFRVVKDETVRNIHLMSASSVLDPDVDYENSDPLRITPYTFNGTSYGTVASLGTIPSASNPNVIGRAEIVHNWFINESTGNHFEGISQPGIEMTGLYEGATMFKFIDRDEWCIMIDNYSSSAIRYEPYTTFDLSKPNSVTKAAAGTYGRTGGDVGCHGGMIPVTVKEYNTLIDTYNSNTEIDNYHPIEHIEVDRREIGDVIAQIEEFAKTPGLTAAQKRQLQNLLVQATSMQTDPTVASADIQNLIARMNSDIQKMNKVSVDQMSVTLEKGKSVTVKATVIPSTDTLTWSSDNVAVATVNNGVIRAVNAGSTFVRVRSSSNKSATVMVTVTASTVKPTPVPVKVPSKGTKFTVKGYQYKVTKSAAKNGTVTLVKPTKKNTKKAVVPSTVSLKGYTFKVTAISAKAFRNNRKLKTVTIGKNVTNIGRQAFAGCKVLKTITIKATALKKVGAKAFTGIRKNAKIKVPAKQLTKYKRLLKGKGQKKTVKITKK